MGKNFKSPGRTVSACDLESCLVVHSITVPRHIGAISDDELLELLHLALSYDTSNTVKRARELMRSTIYPMQFVSQLANLIIDILAGKCQRSACEVKDRLFSGHLYKYKLSSVGCSVDAKDGNPCLRTIYEQDPDGHLCRTSSTSESLKHLTSCACESMESCKRGMQDDKETLAFIWYRATEMCESNSFANFLRRGKLSSIFFSKVAVHLCHLCEYIDLSLYLITFSFSI